MVAPVYIYNPMKISQIYHQNDRELMIFHRVYDTNGLGRKNKKGLKYVLMRPSFFKENDLEWNFLSAEFKALSLWYIFELNGAWSGLKWVRAYFTNTQSS
jgi:hypothetical protein